MVMWRVLTSEGSSLRWDVAEAEESGLTMEYIYFILWRWRSPKITKREREVLSEAIDASSIQQG
jgi:hypothetical protein